MTKQALIELRDKVASGNAERFDPLFEIALYPLKNDMKIVYLANDANLAQDRTEGSLDAAVAFLEAVLPGWWWNLAPTFAHVMPPHDNGDQEASSGYSEIPARALLLATLEALIARAE